METNRRSVARLSRYRSAFDRFKSYGATWVYSEQIASSLGITAAQVRKDFSQFGMTGKRKIGYHVERTSDHLNLILRKNVQNTAIIAGFGPLGKALYADYFRRECGVRITAAFDESASANPPLHGKDEGLPVYPLSDLVGFVMKHGIAFGIIAFTDQKAQKALDLMVCAGIRGILSLSPVELKSPKFCVVNSVNVIREFENVVYFTGNNNGGNGKAHRE